MIMCSQAARLVREPSNPKDPQGAILVTNMDGVKSGYVQAVESIIMAPLIDNLGITFEGRISPLGTRYWDIPTEVIYM